MTSIRTITAEGLWTNNPAMVQPLGLCPLLAVSNTFASALGLGLTTLAVLTCSNLFISLFRGLLHDSIRLPAQIMVIASFVTLADILLQYWFFDLHQRIGLFVALIVTNCILLGRATSFASRNAIAYATLDGFMMGCGFLGVLLLMGTIREVIGLGTLFSNMQLLLGDSGHNLELRFWESGFLLLVLPPGAFLTLGCIIALKNRFST
ncbi:MAG: electron transport complex subunit E [Proteobacteria bacterium]|nr:electron transport complex subunit E [Pseudomonadota bacterium]